MSCVLSLSLALVLAIASACASGRRDPTPYDFDFRGPGRVAVIWETETPAGDLERALVVHDARGSRVLPVADALDVRWLGSAELLVGVVAPPAAAGELPRVRLLVVNALSGVARPFGEPAVYFDPEPSPDARWVAVGVQLDDRGASELELWSTSDVSSPLAERPEALDEPRWSPDGLELVATATTLDPEGEASETSLSVEGVDIGWPRLFRLRRDLGGGKTLVHDGAPGAESAPGGSVPLWWDATGIFARQRAGLVRCDPAGRGCERAYDPGERKRVLGGRAFAGEALLLVVDTRAGNGERIANELHRVNLARGKGKRVFRATGTRVPIELDWGPE